MSLRQLAKPHWQGYLDRVSAALGARLVEIEVSGLGLGDRVEAEWLPLIGATHEPRSDLLTVMAEGVQHLIRHPKHIRIDHDAEWLHSLEALDADGVQHYVLLREPQRLPAP